MKNELGDIPKVDLDDEVIDDDKSTKVDRTVEVIEEVKPEVEVQEELPKTGLDKNLNKNYYTNRDKLNKILTIVLVSAITIVVLLLLGFGLKKIIDLSNARKAEEENKKLSDQIGIESGPGDTEIETGTGEPILTDDPGNIDGSQAKKKIYYKGYEVVGYLRVPKTGINYPVIKPMSNKSLEVSVTQEYTISGVNQPGNTTISGHNYRNDMFFAKNYKIELGDAIYVKDMNGVELKYDVYDIQEVGENDKSFVQRNTNGAIEVTLSTCTDNVVNRIVIFARYNPPVE